MQKTNLKIASCTIMHNSAAVALNEQIKMAKNISNQATE
jgi:hypothetical protein